MQAVRLYQKISVSDAGDGRLSKNPLAKGFGGKDRVKENRQGFLSRPIK